MKNKLFIFFIFLIIKCNAQISGTLVPRSESVEDGIMNMDSVGSYSKTDNIYNKAVFGDSLSSSFCIIIKKEVKSHKHLNHSESVIVMEGKGIMKLGDKKFSIKRGDLIFIPKNTAHSVKTTSANPLKIISVQSPLFDGKDRVMVEEK